VKLKTAERAKADLLGIRAYFDVTFEPAATFSGSGLSPAIKQWFWLLSLQTRCKNRQP
jgi:hypothetical protein